jgi:DNA-binding CsgD family transcriptional regulator
MRMARAVDPVTKQKRLDDAYPTDRAYGIYALLAHIHYLRESRFLRGDYEASILLLDFYRSLRDANLTRRQRQILYLVFVEDMTQQDVAMLLNISQQAVSDHVGVAVKKIALTNRLKEVRHAS